MTSSPLRFLTASCALFLLASAVYGQTAIITKARSYLGSDAALDAVNSIHYTGTLVTTYPADATKNTRATVDIIFQKPDRHRMVMTSDKFIETTGLDAFEAWQKIEYPADPKKGRLALANADQVKRLRANTWENLGFFRGIETLGGRLEVMEPMTIDGILCNRIAFVYSPKVVFYRYFNQLTGKLVVSETDRNVIREEGEIVVEGIRFPKSIITTVKDGDKTPTTTITFEQIKLNETFPTSFFTFPAFTPKK